MIQRDAPCDKRTAETIDIATEAVIDDAGEDTEETTEAPEVVEEKPAVQNDFPEIVGTYYGEFFSEYGTKEYVNCTIEPLGGKKYRFNVDAYMYTEYVDDVGYADKFQNIKFSNDIDVVKPGVIYNMESNGSSTANPHIVMLNLNLDPTDFGTIAINPCGNNGMSTIMSFEKVR